MGCYSIIIYMDNKKRNMGALPIIMAVIMAVALVQGCSGASKVTGIWQSTIGEEITMELKEDGTIIEYWEDEPTATYAFEQQDDQLIIDQNGSKFVVDISDGELIYLGEVIYRKK